MLALAVEDHIVFIRPLHIAIWVSRGRTFHVLRGLFWCLEPWRTVPGWTSIVLPIYILGGVHMIALGVIGEYIGKIYMETKARPRFIVDEITRPTVAQSAQAPLRIAAE